MDDYYKRSGQIPAFGDWDYANELPITQYFECARQAGLIRFSSSSGESTDHMRPDLYAVPVDHFKKPSRNVAPPRKATAAGGGGGGGGGGGRGREKRGQRAHVMEQKRQQSKGTKVCDVTEPPTKPYHYQLHVQQPNRAHLHHHKSDTVSRPKPVDEDLYKIPPELLHTTKRKKMLGLFACFVPACAS
ncbi:hypothetical protein D8674_007450 [Pyrus ussuriensis x Pyrus communis]|uniref:RIN4 pathogenic type III effector avirulence factor Avr cleavage site domain-containing protein n=1 Tax=Pyrus ussuriensis x Pyrus communis TaxID=2448454 RepID=A0A5N5HUK2_9ROSA|nr:hypothetical protein D8674_007450 [Pyrus ussuriensis x Pyrus communis]